jgi:hypothetical protein
MLSVPWGIKSPRSPGCTAVQSWKHQSFNLLTFLPRRNQLPHVMSLFAPRESLAIFSAPISLAPSPVHPTVAGEDQHQCSSTTVPVGAAGTTAWWEPLAANGGTSGSDGRRLWQQRRTPTAATADAGRRQQRRAWTAATADADGTNEGRRWQQQWSPTTVTVDVSGRNEAHRS